MSFQPERLYILTDLGKSLGRRITPGDRDEVIDYIYSNKTARSSDLAGVLGIETKGLRLKLKPYIQRGLVQEITS